MLGNNGRRQGRGRAQRTDGTFILTLEARKQKADCLVLALSGSTTSRPFSSSRHRYRPVVMWRMRKDCPHFMWLPLQLCGGNGRREKGEEAWNQKGNHKTTNV